MSLRNYLNLSDDAELDLTDGWLAWEWVPVNDALHDSLHEPLDGTLSDFPAVGDDGALSPAVLRLVSERPDVADAMRMPNLQGKFPWFGTVKQAS